MDLETNQIIHTLSIFAVDDSFVDDRFMKVRIVAMHSGSNNKNSNYTVEAIKKSKDSFANIPILADVVAHKEEDGSVSYDYGGHDWHIEDDAFRENQSRRIYDEKVVGFVPENNNLEIVYDEEGGRYYVFVDAFIFREYGNYAADILMARGGKTDVSAEIDVNEFSFNRTTGEIVVHAFTMLGITLLGKDKIPGMKGAHATAVFSMDADTRQQQLTEIMQELTVALNNYSSAIADQNSKEGGKVNMKFNELLEKYSVTAEQVTFDYSTMTDEELEKAFVETFATEGDKDKTPTENVEPEATKDAVKASYTVSMGTQTFAINVSDKIMALRNCVNETYGNDRWYDVEVFEGETADEQYVIMRSYDDNDQKVSYKQHYVSADGTFALVGDRVAVTAQWLTADETKALEDMRTKYAEVLATVQKYEQEPEKTTLLSDQMYALVRNNEEFVALTNDHLNYSVEEVKAKADEILLNAAKNQNFSMDDVAVKPQTVCTPLPSVSTKKKMYGSLFDGIN